MGPPSITLLTFPNKNLEFSSKISISRKPFQTKWVGCLLNLAQKEARAVEHVTRSEVIVWLDSQQAQVESRPLYSVDWPYKPALLGTVQ